MSKIGDNWFIENDEDCYALGLNKTKDLHRVKSEYQLLEVFHAQEFGNVMTLDGRVMITDSDEFVYHELIAHIPALLHDSPKKALVIGGGDGGTVRELLKHKSIEKITLCEIDGEVVEAAKKYFPSVSCGFNDPRVDVIIGDGIEYVKNHKKNAVDLLVIDSTDPIGPGEGLFTTEFYREAATILSERGLMVCQSESPWYESEFLNRVRKNLSGGFGFMYPYVGNIPTYPRGFWSWTIASNHPVDIKKPNKEVFREFEDSLRYLTEDLITACFAIPKFYADKLR